MTVTLIKELPFDFNNLETEIETEGFNFLTKMRLEWFSNKNRFNKTGEALYGVFDKDKLIAIGGINLDPYIQESKVGRVRHIYVLKDYRRMGLGALLVKEIINLGGNYFTKLRLRTDTVPASLFYESLGFQIVSEESATHIWIY